MHILFAGFILACLSYEFDLTIDDICGTYQQSSAVCTNGQSCISIPSTFIDYQSFDFQKGGNYTATHKWATGSCTSSGTVILQVDTLGTLTLNGNASADGFTKVTYTPTSFNVTIYKLNKELYYTNADPGPCLFANEYFSNVSIGCPCNYTFSSSPSDYPLSFQFPGNLSTCPTCPGRFYLNDEVQYGTLRYNQTNIPTLEITSTSNSAATGHGYGAANVKYTLVSTQPCFAPQTLSSLLSVALVLVLFLVI